MPKKFSRESELYEPVKILLESQGYEVKGEIGDLDVMGVRPGEEPVVVELKLGFSLSLFHQAIERQGITDVVYVAVPKGGKRSSRTAFKNNLNLCRRLGLGLITVRPRDRFTEIHLDPAPYTPRRSPRGKALLLREFARRVGDPNRGGSSQRPLITAYRQDALRCLVRLSKSGPERAKEVAAATGVQRARQIMYDNYYGWFQRVEKGVYATTPKGAEALHTFAEAIVALE